MFYWYPRPPPPLPTRPRVWPRATQKLNLKEIRLISPGINMVVRTDEFRFLAQAELRFNGLWIKGGGVPFHKICL